MKTKIINVSNAKLNVNLVLTIPLANFANQIDLVLIVNALLAFMKQIYNSVNYAIRNVKPVKRIV